MSNGDKRQEVVVSSKMNGGAVGSRTNVTLQYNDRKHKKEKMFNPHCCMKFWYCLVGSATYKNLHKRNTRFKNMNSVSIIDRISRFCFPVLFIAFNLFYWIVYLEAGTSDMLM